MKESGQCENSEQNVIISIRGMQSFQGAEAESVELITEGSLQKTAEGAYRLCYEESELTGLYGTRTIFTIEDDMIMLLRTGAVHSQLVFQLGKRHISLYHTSLGDFSVEVHTYHMYTKLGELGGEIQIRYEIELDRMITGDHEFLISVKKKTAE